MTYVSSNLSDLFNLRVAIVHYWFVGYTGGEQVVNALAEMFPKRIYLLLWPNRSACHHLCVPTSSIPRSCKRFLAAVVGTVISCRCSRSLWSSWI